MKRRHGINFWNDGTAEVMLWAPLAETVEIQIAGNKKFSLSRQDIGCWSITTRDIKPGDLYKFILNSEKEIPDPASMSQPEGVHGVSKAIDPAQFKWSDTDWRNIPWKEYIIYELHTGTFSEEGTFDAIISKIGHLLELGVNAIEIMPIAQFPGNRNWGYDGVYPYAAQNSYGGPLGLQNLVNACHNKGIAVILDVVYNHFGPEGNYFTACGPCFTEKYKTPWGSAINFDDAWCDGVRSFFIDNALMWLRDFHIDALRLDAVHAIKDLGPVHILKEIRQHVDELIDLTGKKHYLIVELDLNDCKCIDPIDKGGYGMDAQWIDEFHHALRVTARGERIGYYSDFNGIEHLAKSYRNAYVYDGQWSPHRKKLFGIKTSNPGTQFIVFSQNHDQVGNRMLGERTSKLMSFEMRKLLAGAVMVSPYIPMLFMGEEWSETNSFLYFVSHTDAELAEAVRKGRREEFSDFHIDKSAPDPVAEETFLHSKLQWDLILKGNHAVIFKYYQSLIKLRKDHAVLKDPDRVNLEIECDREKQTMVLHRWNNNLRLICLMNFSKMEQIMQELPIGMEWKKILDSSDLLWGGPGSSSGKAYGPIQIKPESIVIYEAEK